MGDNRYQFRDTDPSGHAEYNIDGEEYITLLKTCIQYCRYLSFRIMNERTFLPPGLVEHMTETTPKISRLYTRSCRSAGRIVTVVVYPELIEDMVQIAKGVFDWITGWGFQNPEDFAFIREDGSLFFHSRIHEGLCWLEPRDGENVESIIADHHWESIAEIEN